MYEIRHTYYIQKECNDKCLRIDSLVGECAPRPCRKVEAVPEDSRNSGPANIRKSIGRGEPYRTVVTVETLFHELTCGKVHKLMGLKDPLFPDQGADTFSDDVLKIEICGPKQQHLSVIDVPGIFRNTTEGMTTDSDIEVVRNMVNHYMKNPRSVILAVVPANVDIATQEILKMAQKCDTKGERTLGVLTKPDLIDRGAEHRVVDLVEGMSPAVDLRRYNLQNTDL